MTTLVGGVRSRDGSSNLTRAGLLMLAALILLSAKAKVDDDGIDGTGGREDDRS